MLPQNSTLLRKLFVNAMDDRLLHPGGSLQILMLTNQFKEWDTFYLAHEAGLMFESCCYLDHEQVPPYKPRDVMGKPINAHAMRGKAILVHWRKPGKLPELDEKPFGPQHMPRLENEPMFIPMSQEQIAAMQQQQEAMERAAEAAQDRTSRPRPREGRPAPARRPTWRTRSRER